MRTVSTGVGLCVLGVCVLGAAALSTSQVGGQAFAQSPAGSGKRTPTPAAKNGGQASSQSFTNGCDAQVWFDPTPHEFLAGCGTLATLPLSPADVNHDGVPELITSLGTVVIADGNPISPKGQISGFVSCSQLSISEAGAMPVSAPVLDLQPTLAESLIALLPDLGGGWCSWTYEIRCSASGWLDCDGDGDLDFVVRADFMKNRFQSWGGDMGPPQCSQRDTVQIAEKFMWFENTGYQASPPPNPYDLDQDGEVGAGDISVLLLNFD